MVTDFTPWSAAIGGVLIGLASAALLFANGRIAGVTGIFDGAIFSSSSSDRAWRVAFLVGMLLAGGVWTLTQSPDMSSLIVDRSTGLILVAGLLVGLGTKMSNGCTSGHGVCGNARLSSRSIVATLTFMATGALTVALLGGA